MKHHIIIRHLEPDDLPAVAAVHVTAYPNSALTTLGAEAARRYYACQMLGSYEVTALGAFLNKELIGICFGGFVEYALMDFLRENQAFLLWRLLSRPWLVMHPLFRQRLMLGARVRLLKRYKKPAPPKMQKKILEHDSFHILSIAVDPRYQGCGAGRLLMSRAEEITEEKGLHKMTLTVHPDNKQAINFYEKMGWKKTLKNGKWEGLMYKLLTQPIEIERTGHLRSSRNR